MNKADNKIIEVPRSIILLGAPGSGKTTLASQFPGAYFVNADNNLDGPIRWLRQNGYPVEFFYDDVLHGTKEDLIKAKIPEKELDGFIDNSAIPRKYRYRYMAYLLNEAVKNPEVKTIVLDSMTSISDICLDEVRRQNNLAFGDPLNNVSLDVPLRIQDWGSFASLWKNLMYQLMGSGKRLIVTGHIKVEKDDVLGTFQEFINIAGSSSVSMGGNFQEVWLLSVVSKMVEGKRVVTRTLRTAPAVNQIKLGLKSSIQLEAEQELDLKKIVNLLQ